MLTNTELPHDSQLNINMNKNKNTNTNTKARRRLVPGTFGYSFCGGKYIKGQSLCKGYDAEKRWRQPDSYGNFIDNY